MSADDRRRAEYIAAYAERFGRVPRATPEFIPSTSTGRTDR